jgi:D-aspartate ligase
VAPLPPSASNENPAAVLLGGENTAVSAARSLAAIGVQVYGLGDTHDPVRYSRACSVFADVGSKEGVEERYVEWLRDGPRGAVVFACYDDGLDVISRNRAQLEDWGYRPVEGNDEVNLAMMDKVRSLELCRQAGVPAPRTRTVRSREDAERAAAELDYPCALKPIQSHLFARHFGETKLLTVERREELLEAFDRTSAVGVDVLATELIPGGDDQISTYYTYLDDRGEPLYNFTKRKLRQWPVHFGLACYQLTTWEPEVAEVGLRFCQGVGIRGMGTVEFKRDPRDGSYKFIECNPRLTGSNELVRYAGIEVAQIAYLRALGRPVAPVRRYRTGVHEWYPPEDVKAFVAYRAAGELGAGRWIASLMHRQHFPMLRPSDPWPTLATSGRRALNIARRRLQR